MNTGTYFISLVLFIACVFGRDIVLERNDERLQRYLKNYRRTSASNTRSEISNKPEAIPYRGRYTGGGYSQSVLRSRYQTSVSDYERQRLEQEKRERLLRERQEYERRAEQERLERERQQQERQRQADQERLERERRHDVSQRQAEQQRLERQRLANRERQRQIEIERRQREEQIRIERQRQEQAEYERREREKQQRIQEERRQQEERRRREEEERIRRQEQERQRLEEQRRRQQTKHGAVGPPGRTDLDYVRHTLRTELQGIVDEMRRHYEASSAGRNMLHEISRQMEKLLARLDEQMRQEPRDETRNMRQELHHWMGRLEEMAREDSFNCQTAQRDIGHLKAQIEYLEQLIMSQDNRGYRGSQSRRSTTPRPLVVPERSDYEHTATVVLQSPEETHGDRNQQRRNNQGSRSNQQVDKWLPATRERYNTQIAASRNKQRHITQREHESQRKSDEFVRGLVESNRKPWKRRRDRRPIGGLTGLLDPRVIERAEVDSTGRDREGTLEHSASQTIVVDSPWNREPDWLIKQGQEASSDRRELKEINVYHHNTHPPGRDDEKDPKLNVVEYASSPQSESRLRTDFTGKAMQQA